MKTPTVTTTCPKCGGTIPAEAQQGLCPKCALAAVAAPTEGDEVTTKGGPPPPLEQVATAFPQLEILGLIGQGGMGAVYRARQIKLDRVVALKLLAEPTARGGAFAERFHREARLLAKLNHPGIVAVHDYGEAAGFYYLLMEYVDGVNLRQAMRAGRFTPAQALALVPKICEALQYAHDEGILHRDIKPENILLDGRGRVKIADFGIAKLMGDRAKDAALTGSGLAVGTPHYMAPEQLDHPQDVDQRADIYSLGVVFYEMLTGELPLGRFAPPSQKTPVDPRVDEVVLQALERERERRQRTVTEVKTGVERITSTPASPPAPAAAEPPGQAVVEPKSALCYVTTPEHLRTFRGRYFHLYQGNGQLRLDERSLSFVSGWQRVTIPLASIRSLTLGRYALTAKPVPLDYLEVTFLEGPDSRTLLFTPTPSGLLPVWETNKAVAEWATAVQEAVQAATGRTIELNRSVAARGRFWHEVWETYGLTAALCTWPFLLMPILFEHRAPTQWMDWLLGPLVATVVLGTLLLTRWLMERRALRKGSLSEIATLPVAYEKDDPILFRKPEVLLAQPGQHPPLQSSQRVSAGKHLFYLVIYLLLCFLALGPWLPELTGNQLRSPVPDSIGQPLAFLTLLLIAYGAIAKATRHSRSNRQSAAAHFPPPPTPTPDHPQRFEAGQAGPVPPQAGNVSTRLGKPIMPARAAAEPPEKPDAMPTGEQGLRAVCYFSTPERMRNCFPGATAPLFHCAGELRLKVDQISFTSALRATLAIPLRQIRALGVGMFRMWNTPWLGTRYERLHYLVLTFEEDGILKTVALTPVPEGADTAAAINRCAGEWHDAVLDSIGVLGLPAPSSPPRDLLLAGVQENWWRVIGPLLGVALIATLATVRFTERPNAWLLLSTSLPTMIICLLGIGFFRMNTAIQQGRLDSFAGEEPPESIVCPVADRRSRPAVAKGISWTAVFSAVCSLPTWWIIMGLLFRLHASLGPDGLPPQVFLIGMWELITACTGVVALSLGARALREVRVSAGQIRGARLAIIGILALPAGCLVKLGPQLMASAARGFGWHPTAEQGALFVGGTLIGIFILLVGAAWRLRQWVQPEKSSSS